MKNTNIGASKIGIDFGNDLSINNIVANMLSGVVVSAVKDLGSKVGEYINIFVDHEISSITHKFETYKHPIDGEIVKSETPTTIEQKVVVNSGLVDNIEVS